MIAPSSMICTGDVITVVVKNILGTEETDVKIPPDATVGQLLQRAGQKLQINPQGATVLYQGQQLSPERPLFKEGVRDRDVVMIAPGSIIGGAGLPFEVASQVVAPIVIGIVANYLYDKLRGTDLKELTKRLFIGTFSQNKHLIPGKKIQYDAISEKIAELIHQELRDWKEINEKHGVEILKKLLSEKSVGIEELRSVVENDSELAETLEKMVTTGKVQIEIHLKKDILHDAGNILQEGLLGSDPTE